MDLSKNVYFSPLSAITKGRIYTYDNPYADRGTNYPLFQGLIYVPFKLLHFAQQQQYYQKVFDVYSGKHVWMLRFGFRQWEWQEGKSYKIFEQMGSPLYTGNIYPYARDIKNKDLRRIASMSNKKISEWADSIQDIKKVIEYE